MTDASVNVPTVAALWEQHRCLLSPLPPSSPPLSLILPSPLLSAGRDEGITRQEQSSQQYSDHTGMVLHAHGGREVMERPRPPAQGLSCSPLRWQQRRGYKCGGQRVRTEERLCSGSRGSRLRRWGPRRSAPARKADVFTRGRAKFSEQPSAAWRSGVQ